MLSQFFVKGEKMNHYILFEGDCLQVLPTIDDESVDLVVTSPPYNVRKEYEKEKLSGDEYLVFMSSVFSELYRVLKVSGRICFNVPFSMNDKGIPFYILPKIMNAFEKTPLKYRHLIVWDQLNSGSETAWGSWKSPSAPWLRHLTEFILLGYKDTWKKQHSGESDLTTDEFMKYTLDKWRFPSKSNSKHPAPFPEELPHRCIKLFSYVNDVVLDPFLGSGTTMKVAQDLRRSCMGVEIEPKYIEMIKKLCWGRQFLDHEVYYDFRTSLRKASNENVK